MSKKVDWSCDPTVGLQRHRPDIKNVIEKTTTNQMDVLFAKIRATSEELKQRRSVSLIGSQSIDFSFEDTEINVSSEESMTSNDEQISARILDWQTFCDRKRLVPEYRVQIVESTPSPSHLIPGHYHSTPGPSESTPKTVVRNSQSIAEGNNEPNLVNNSLSAITQTDSLAQINGWPQRIKSPKRLSTYTQPLEEYEDNGIDNTSVEENTSQQLSDKSIETEEDEEVNEENEVQTNEDNNDLVQTNCFHQMTKSVNPLSNSNKYSETEEEIEDNNGLPQTISSQEVIQRLPQMRNSSRDVVEEEVDSSNSWSQIGCRVSERLQIKRFEFFTDRNKQLAADDGVPDVGRHPKKSTKRKRKAKSNEKPGIDIFNLSFHNKKIKFNNENKNSLNIKSFDELIWTECPQSKGVDIAIREEVKGEEHGVIRIKGMAKKKLSKPERETRFNVNLGAFGLKIDANDEELIKTGDYFTVNSNNTYSLMNLRKDIAYLSFVGKV